MEESLVDVLTTVAELKSVPRVHLEWLAGKGEIIDWKDGDRAFSPGDPVDDMRIILKGQIKVYMEQAGGLRYFDAIETLEITGLLPYSRMKGAAVHGIISGDTTALSINKRYFPEMIREHHELTEALVHSMTDRVRYGMKQEQINDKMVSLGKLSAGIAHELNNPSAAVVRGAHELKKHLRNVPERFKAVISIKATAKEVDEVNDLLFRKIAATSSAKRSLQEKMTCEDELTAWLEEHHVAQAYTMAETFADYDFSVDDLEHLTTLSRPEDLPAIVMWLWQMLTTERLVSDIEEASKRINALVTSVKTYTHMDRGVDKERADVVDGIRNTLTLLGHKLKSAGVKVVEDFQSDLPKPHMFVSMMNQVWTNIIDNAVDAMEGRSGNLLEIHAHQDREFVIVRLIDNGPGIPKDIQDKIFDSFFTTKPVGKGTGLGLEMVRQIVHQQHNGKVEVRSEPGRTEFRVCIPI
ncbi:MAG TPA: ATP-binding protein [Chryseolinea sp.]|nr:ATP-binding protein [Chryseolinea sp.]